MAQPTNGNSDNLVRPVFLVDRGTYQGYSSYIRRILVGLSGTAHASALVCPGCVRAESILCPAVESFEHPALRLPIFRQQNRRILLDRLSRFKPTVLHAFYPGLGHVSLAKWLSKMLDIPYVVTFHRHAAKWQKFKMPIHNAAAIIAPSESIAEQIGQSRLAPAERIERIHVGSFVEDDCRCFSEEGRIASLVVAHPLDDIGVFEPLLKAIRHLTMEGTELLLVIMGKGRKEKHIRRRIRELGLTASVTVIPPMQPMRSILSGADIYLNLEDRGLYDAQLTEAMAVGLAVAGSPEKNTGLLTDGETAAFWNPTDEQSIYGCLKKCLGQRAETRQLALNAQAHLRRHNSVSLMVEKLMQTYTHAQQKYKEKAQKAEDQPVAV